MEHDTSIPPPISLIERLRAIPVGSSALYETSNASTTSVRSTLTRIMREDKARRYTTRPEEGGLRVWRLT